MNEQTFADIDLQNVLVQARAIRRTVNQPVARAVLAAAVVGILMQSGASAARIARARRVADADRDALGWDTDRLLAAARSLRDTARGGWLVARAARHSDLSMRMSVTAVAELDNRLHTTGCAYVLTTFAVSSLKS